MSYLRWMVSVGHEKAEHAKEELDRRGTVIPEVEVSGHAIDRASQRCLDVWRGDLANPNEGLHAWLSRVAKEALDRNQVDAKGRFYHKGCWWAIDTGLAIPVLKSVVRRSKGQGPGCAGARSPASCRHDRREGHVTEADRQTWMRL